MPLLIIAIAFLPTLFALQEDDSPTTIGIIDQTHQLLNPLDAKLSHAYRIKKDQPNYVLRNLTENKSVDELKENANQMVASGSIEGFFFIPATMLDSGKVEYRAKNVGNMKIQERFSHTLEQIIVEKRLTASGLDTSLIKKLHASVDVKSIKLSTNGEEKESGFVETFAGAYINLLMIMFMVLTSGQLLVRSVVEEKSNRVMEVLLSSCSARDLMAGKILGLSGLGILQMFVYMLIGVAISLKSNAPIFVPENLILTILYALLGYVFYAAIFVTVGAPANTEQEAQQITSYVSMIMVLPIGFMIVALQHPDSTIVKVLSFIPFLTPSLMAMRIPIQMPAPWEILSTLAILTLSMLGMMWVAGKIFRMAILSYGKRPSLGELFRWIRES
jgi:ABC-2 type transport system permease protein